MLDKLVEKELDNCREIILGDAKLEEIDAVFYNLLDKVQDDIKMKMEDAYIEYGTRAIYLAYSQGLKDAKEKDKDAETE